MIELIDNILCGILPGLVVVLGVVAALRVKDNSTAINRRQADRGVNNLQAGINRQRDNLSRIGKVSGGGESQRDRLHLIPLTPGKQFKWMALRPVHLAGVTSAYVGLLSGGNRDE